VTQKKCACEGTIGAVSLKRRLTIARMIFASQPLEFRKALKSPPQKQLRKEARNRGSRFYEAADLRKLVKVAEPHLRAMILLGINCGMGNKDCITLPTHYIDLKNGWHNYHRPKTEVDRRCKLWPETVKALKVVASESVVFNGRKWDRWVVGSEFEKLCKACKVKSHGFYSLRRTFETIAGASGCQQFIIDRIMGHSRPNDMAAAYRQKIFDGMLQKCTDFVRGWYLGNITID
jgi:integrase